MPASSSSSTSCQRFSFREPGTFVWASSSTSATSGRRARSASTSISSNAVLPVVDRAARDDLQVADLRARLLAAVGLDDADDDVGAAIVASTALAEHRERLADARRRAEVDAEDAAGHRPSGPESALGVECEVEREDVHPRLPHEPERSFVRVLVDELEHAGELQPTRSGNPGRLEPGVGRRDVRVEPRARRRHGIHRDGRIVVEAVQLAVGGGALLDGGEEVGVRRAEVRRGARRAVVAVAGGRRDGDGTTARR